MIKVIFLLLVSLKSYAGDFCVGDLVASPVTTVNQFTYDCICPDRMPKNFKLDESHTHFGKCRDHYKYRLNVNLFNTPPVMWLDATRFRGAGSSYLPSSVDGATRINSVSDLSNFGNNLQSVANGTNSPTLLHRGTISNGQSGIPRQSVFYQVGNGTYSKGQAALSSTISLDNITLFVVYKSETSVALGTPKVIVSLAASNNPVLEIQQTDNQSVAAVFPTTVLSNNTNQILNDPAYTGYFAYAGTMSSTQNNTNLLVLRTNNRNVEFYINPYQQAYTAHQSPHMSGRVNFNKTTYPSTITGVNQVFVADNNLNPAISARNFLGLQIHEIILFNRTLSHGERREIEFYLRRKWGVTGNLPNQS